MAIHTPRPVAIDQMVRQWIDSRCTEAGKYENVTFALDADSARQLHELAANVYATGFNDGLLAAAQREMSAKFVSKRIEEEPHA